MLAPSSPGKWDPKLDTTSSRSELRILAEIGNGFAKENVLLPVNETAHRIMTDHCQADATVTYSLISALGENIQHQRNSSSGISIFLENTSRFIPIQWHSKLSILDTDQQIYFNILPP